MHVAANAAKTHAVECELAAGATEIDAERGAGRALDQQAAEATPDMHGRAALGGWSRIRQSLTPPGISSEASLPYERCT